MGYRRINFILMDSLCYIGLPSQPTTRIETYISEKNLCFWRKYMSLFLLWKIEEAI